MKLLDLFEYNDNNIKWAVGARHLKNATPPHQNRHKHGHYDDKILAWVRIKDLFDNTEKNFALDINDPLGGPNHIRDRVPRATIHWNEGGWMDPSEISWNDWFKKIQFSDGRHRLVAAYQRGYKWAPVLINKDDIAAIRSVMPVRFRRPTKITESAGTPNVAYYGSWLNSLTGEILNVGDYAHAKTILGWIKRHFDPAVHTENVLAYPEWWAIQNGWVRLTHRDFSGVGTLGIDGKKTAIKRAWSKLVPIVKNAEHIFIDFIREKFTIDDPSPYDYSISCQLPVEHTKLISALNESAGSIKFRTYGAWFNTITNKYIPVDDFEHLKAVYDNPELFGLDPVEIHKQPYKNISINGKFWDKFLPTIYNAGWVRLEHDTPYEFIGMQGTIQAVKLAWKLLLGRVDTERISIDVVDHEGRLIADKSWDIKENDFIDKLTASKNKRAMISWFSS